MKDTFLQLLAKAQIDNERAGIPQVNATNVNIDRLIAGVFALWAAICVIFIIIGGIRYVISQGDPAKISQAKDTVLYALVGLVVTGASFFIVQLVINLAR